MAASYIIDAYNVIRLVLTPAELASGSEGSRRALEARVRAFGRACGPGTRIHLVFDGDRGIPAPPRREKGLEILFSRPPRKADDVVLDLARSHEGEPELYVVTSDFTDIATRLRGLRLRHLTSRDFAELVSRRLRAAGASREAGGREGHEEKPAKLDPGEVDAWAREFGFGAGQDAGSP